MKHATYTIAVALFHCTASATPSPVAFESPCSCRGEHAKGRLSAKNDPALPPPDARPIQAVTPSDVYSSPGADAQLMCQSERTGIENMRFALTGRVVDVRIEMDGDLDIALQDATGNRARHCCHRNTGKTAMVRNPPNGFRLDQDALSISNNSMRKLNLNAAPTVAVIGKAFFGTGHALKSHINRRKHMPRYAAWEIHPVMKLDVR